MALLDASCVQRVSSLILFSDFTASPYFCSYTWFLSSPAWFPVSSTHLGPVSPEQELLPPMGWGRGVTQLRASDVAPQLSLYASSPRVGPCSCPGSQGLGASRGLWRQFSWDGARLAPVVTSPICCLEPALSNLLTSRLCRP